MATTGVLRSNAVDNGTFFYVNWRRTSYSVADNTSTISWELWAYTAHNYYLNAVRNYGVYINGTKVYDGGVWSNLYSGTNTQLASGSIIIPHNQDGTKTFNISTSGWFYENYNTSGSGDFDLNAIPRKASLTNADNFDDEANPKITYTNNAGNSVTSLQARIESVDGNTIYATYRDVPKTQGEYTFPLTTTERDDLRDATPNSNEMNVVFRLKTVIGSYNDTTTLTRKMNIINANPTFNNFTYEDTNATTTALTGNNQICVLGYSNIKAIISSANKAVANKGASMVKYQFVCGNVSKDITYNGSSEVNGTIDNVTSGTFTIYAIDSRGNSTPKTITANTIKDYVNIYLNTSNSTLTRNQSGTGSSVTLHYEGTIWNESFGSVNNSVVSATYSYKKTSASTYTPGTTSIMPTLSGNNLSFTGVIGGDGTGGAFDVSSSYNVQITLTDKLSTYTINLILGSGTPNIAYADDGIAVMGDYDENLGGALQVSGKLNAINDANVGGELTVKNVQLSRAGNTSATSFDDVGTNGKLNKSGLYSESISGTWYNLINVRHKNGNSDGVSYGMQINSAFALNDPINIRKQSNGSWGQWEQIYRCKNLYNDTSGTTGKVTLNESCANFTYIEILYCNNNNSEYFSTKIYSPNNKNTHLNLIEASSANQSYIRRTKYTISGTTITPDTTSAGYVYLNGTSISHSNNSTNYIKIVRVDGYR